ncbi:MAG: ABC transporter ATP-binding protein [Oxalobacter sp.]|nr:MAG: ABC transporter ATP-binding protein [Oxalobacter sp.]
MMRVRSLRLHSGAKALLELLDWHVRPGECWCVIGKNGAGKSTLLRTLAGLREADGGEVLLEDRLLANWPLLPLARLRAYLPQSRTDAFGFCAIETVLAARHAYHAGRRWESSEDHYSAMAALQAMDVADLAHRDVRTLSGGERQRVAIAALLAQDAPLMLLDEPANALDLAHQVSTMNLFSLLCREQNKAIVMAGHDLNLAHGVATHALLLMGDGWWRAGSVEEVMTGQLLSLCLGYPVEQIMHNGRVIYAPAV